MKIKIIKKILCPTTIQMIWSYLLKKQKNNGIHGFYVQLILAGWTNNVFIIATGRRI